MPAAKRRLVWIIGIGSLAIIGGGFWLAHTIHRNRLQAELNRQLKLAWAEGIPTDVAELDSLLPHVAPKDNAGPLYDKLQEVHWGQTSYDGHRLTIAVSGPTINHGQPWALVLPPKVK